MLCHSGSMSFEKKKTMSFEKKNHERNVEDLEWANLVETTHLTAPPLLVSNKDGTYRLVADYRDLNKQTMKTC